jgi:hypothetical protein
MGALARGRRSTRETSVREPRTPLGLERSLEASSFPRTCPLKRRHSCLFRRGTPEGLLAAGFQFAPVVPVRPVQVARPRLLPAPVEALPPSARLPAEAPALFFLQLPARIHEFNLTLPGSATQSITHSSVITAGGGEFVTENIFGNSARCAGPSTSEGSLRPGKSKWIPGVNVEGPSRFRPSTASRRPRSTRRRRDALRRAS